MSREVRIPDAEVARGNAALPDYGWYLLAHGVKRSDVRGSFYDFETSEMVFLVADPKEQE